MVCETLEIRTARVEDAAAIAGINTRGWQVAYAGILDQTYLDGISVEKRTARWKENLEKGDGSQTYVATTGGQVVGFASVGLSREANFANYIELYAIYIEPEFWGKGAGKALFDTVRNYAVAASFDKMFVNVLSDNKLGCSFYERTGAKEIVGSAFSTEIGGQSYEEIKYEWLNLRA